jgi:hypothetical protein
MALWTASDWKSLYNASGLTDAQATDLLADAESDIEVYITEDAYDDATAVSPTDTNAYRKIRKAVALLARLYALQQSFLSPPTDKYTESYSGVKSYSISSGTGAQAIAAGVSEQSIYRRLAAYARETTFEPCSDWGTGRFITVSSSDEDEE